jgi:hypothetical protein
MSPTEKADKEITAPKHHSLKLPGNVIVKLAGRTEYEAEVIEQGVR